MHLAGLPLPEVEVETGVEDRPPRLGPDDVAVLRGEGEAGVAGVELLVGAADAGGE